MASATDKKDVQPLGPATNTSTKIPGKSLQRRPNYSAIHSKPLPVEVYPLPAFIPHNPLSLLRIAYTVLSQYAFPPSSQPQNFYEATFSPETRSVVVTDLKTIRALWESGFFGKGSLSRSEPTWLAQERKRRGLDGGLTSEMYTQQRRRERVEMKNERARLQREAVEEQLKAEQSAGSTEDAREVQANSDSINRQSVDGMLPNYSGAWEPTSDSVGIEASPSTTGVFDREDANRTGTSASVVGAAGIDLDAPLGTREPEDHDIKDEEHLQLSLEEAFFLVYALGILRVHFATRQAVTEARHLFQTLRKYSYSPPRLTEALCSEDPFLINYVVYHHFRSLGWVIRPGNKFAVDFLLYKGGPVFSHAEFALVIIPSYVDEWWFETSTRRVEVESKRKDQQWWWVQNMNRVQSQVLKTLILVYVDIPPPHRIDDLAKKGDVGGVLKQYKLREFALKRWTPNRQRE